MSLARVGAAGATLARKPANRSSVAAVCNSYKVPWLLHASRDVTVLLLPAIRFLSSYEATSLPRHWDRFLAPGEAGH
jgi:hypothetical protein